MTEPSLTKEAQAHADAEAAEYGTWVATDTIFYDGARAFNVGDAVPVSHVAAYGYDKDGLVSKVAKTAVKAAPSKES